MKTALKNLALTYASLTIFLLGLYLICGYLGNPIEVAVLALLTYNHFKTD